MSFKVLRYENGQKYDSHWDWFDDTTERHNLDGSGNRVATVLMYLSGMGISTEAPSLHEAANEPFHV